MKFFIKFLPFIAPLFIYGQSSDEMEGLLKAYFESNPQADYNSDGILTKQEASKHRKMENYASKQRSQLAKMPERTLADHTYGPNWRNTLDFWKADSSRPTPVLLFFHPGGFVGGDKSRYYGDPLAMACLKNGISVVMANYRYAMQAPFPASHRDAARVIQYVRFHAETWGIDSSRVAMTGASAGGNMSVWLAVHDDLADPNSNDPVSRESTRLTTIIGFNSQTSNDQFFIWDKIYQGKNAHSSIYDFYGIKRMPIDAFKEKLALPKYRKIAHEATALNHISNDDPPVFLVHPESLSEWNGQPLPPETPQPKYIHHIAFGKYFKDRYDEIGLPCKIKGVKESSVEEQMDWLRKWFGME